MEYHRLSVFENRVLRKILGLHKWEVTGDWRRSLSEEPDDLGSYGEKWGGFGMWHVWKRGKVHTGWGT
jgi:hypothetical protein